jgi:hypothetical protein
MSCRYGRSSAEDEGRSQRVRHGGPRGGMSVACWASGGNSVCMVTFTTSHNRYGHLASRPCLAGPESSKPDEDNLRNEYFAGFYQYGEPWQELARVRPTGS